MAKSNSSVDVEAFTSPSNKEASGDGLRYRPRRWWQIGGQDISHVSINAGYEAEATSSSSSSSENLTSGGEDIFVAPEALEVYKPIEGFEGAHRFDPSATWTKEEEAALIRKV